MHILEAALVHAVADAAKTRSKTVRCVEVPNLVASVEPTSALSLKTRDAVCVQTGWRRWFARQRPALRA